MRGPRHRHHFSEVPIDGDRRRRTISNWQNFHEPGGPWERSNPNPAPAEGVPNGWIGDFTFSHFSRRGALQSALGVDGAGRPHVRVRRADNRAAWAEFVWRGGKPTTLEEQLARRRLVFHGFAPQTAIAYVTGRHRLDKVMRFAAPGHPTSSQFAMRRAPGITHKLVGQSIILHDDRGIEVLRTSPPCAWDSSIIAPTIDGKQSIRVVIAEIGITPQRDPIFELTLDPNDLAGAVYPVYLDPTIIISGTADIEDNYIATINTNTNRNFGGSGFMFVGRRTSTILYRDLIRFDETQIPAGTITALRLKIWQRSFFLSLNAQTVKVYRVAAGNDWVEGTATGTAQTGSSCWKDKQYNISTWLGGVNSGCGVAGTDYDADASPPSQVATMPYTSGPDIEHSVTLPSVWATDWRDGVHDNEGILLLGAETTDSTVVQFPSTEDGTSPPVFEIDFTLVAPGSKYFFIGF